jgi:hypothetical protein
MPKCSLPRNHRRLAASSLGAVRAATAAAAVAILGACGGGGSSNSATPPPAGGGATGGSTATLYLAGPAGIDYGTGGNINFAGTPSAGTDLTLTSVTPATGAGASLAQAGSWIGEAQVGQWTAAAGNATAIGARFTVYAGTDNRFHVADLKIASGSSAPATALFSSLAPSAVCSSLPTVINDLANPANSVLVFDTPGTSNSCGALDDVYNVVPLSSGPGTAPATASAVEPVDAVRDASGAITQLLLLVHASPRYVAVSSGTGLASPTTIGTLTGTGNNSGGASRDFQSLAVIPVGASTVWLYRDSNGVYGVNLSTPTQPVQVFLDFDEDVVQGPAIVDGTTAYLALIDQTHFAPTPPPECCTNQVVRIDASNLQPYLNGGGTVLITELSQGLQLLGIAGNNLYYEFSDGSALKFIDKTSSGSGASTQIFPFPSGGTSKLYTAGSPPVVVSGGIYFTVSTPGAANALQAWFCDGTTSSSLGSFSQVLGGVTASTVATADAGIAAADISNLNVTVSPVAPPYASALVAILPTSNTAPSIYPAATIATYGSSGARTATLGTLFRPIADDYDALSVAPGLLQTGVPALLQVSGYSASTSYTGHDLYQIIPGTANSLIQVTKNLQ